MGTPVVRTDAASIHAIGETWWEVPPIVQINLTGTLPPGVTGKDVIVTLAGSFGNEVLNHVIEFSGPGVATLTVDERLSISNMTTEFVRLHYPYMLRNYIANSGYRVLLQVWSVFSMVWADVMS